MRSHSGRPTTVILRIATPTRPQRGFSLIELLVTIVIAGVVFAAMVPFFANGLKASSRDQERNVAANIAADRIEQVRLLDYQTITAANLTAPPSPFGMASSALRTLSRPARHTTSPTRLVRRRRRMLRKRR